MIGSASPSITKDKISGTIKNHQAVPEGYRFRFCLPGPSGLAVYQHRDTKQIGIFKFSLASLNEWNSAENANDNSQP